MATARPNAARPQWEHTTTSSTRQPIRCRCTTSSAVAPTTIAVKRCAQSSSPGIDPPHDGTFGTRHTARNGPQCDQKKSKARAILGNAWPNSAWTQFNSMGKLETQGKRRKDATIALVYVQSHSTLKNWTSCILLNFRRRRSGVK